jgi:hypothetical protein
VTFSAIERLPDGRERVLARGLSLGQVRVFQSPTPWALTFRQES